MFWDILAPEFAPFAVALGAMLLIGALELIGLMFGLGLSSIVDSMLPDFDAPDVDIPALELPDTGLPDAGLPDVDLVDAGAAGADASGGPFFQFLGWLYVGRVPALVLLVAFLTSFGLSGIAVQNVASAITGSYLPALIAAVPALAASLPATRFLGFGLSKLVPKEESEAVSRRRFKGAIATIIRGVATRGMPAEAKLKDWHGQTHYVLIEPDSDEGTFTAGDEVLIIRQDGSIFRAIPLE